VNRTLSYEIHAFQTGLDLRGRERERSLLFLVIRKRMEHVEETRPCIRQTNYALSLLLDLLRTN
jgi:hypothetical protein